MIKKVILFTALLLPILIFIFLKLFGKNKFELPVYHTETLPVVPSECTGSFDIPYRIIDSKLIEGDRTSVVAFYGGLSETEIFTFNKQLNRLREEFKSEDFDLVIDESLTRAMERQCVFLMEDNRMVLVDALGRVRGYYKDSSLKETDRLALELNILLKNY